MKIEDLKAYEILEDRDSSDLGSRAIRVRHKKTGAKFALLSNNDDNKVFYIGFRTPPNDSTGVAHITEHSVLCGSKNFPVKDPFVELAKGSLNTFLNAMTYPDKTVYPVASCNDADFQNLMHVYLDAVFYPNTYLNESIFRQEGWHYEFDEEGKLFINGVVYNEMKGAFSSPDDVLARNVMNSLYPETSYGVESGGDPDNIPDLTYEQFLDFHRAYYHPSNSYIYLYGDMDMAEKLDYIDKEYLSNFEYREVDSTLKKQPAFNCVNRSIAKCSLNEGENANENTFLSLNYSIGESTDKKLSLALTIIDYALCTTPGAPLKKALVEKGIGKDVYSVCETGILQPYFSIVAKDTEISKEKEFLDTIDEVLKEIADKGFDKKALLAGINYFEFQYREADFGRFPKGLMYGLQALDSWLYDDEKPFDLIEALDTYKFLRENIDTGYFENIIRDMFINNTHASIVILEPELGLEEKKQEELAKKLAKYQASLSDAEIDKIKDDFTKLNAFQEQVDLPENLAKLPLLSRNDLRKEATPFNNTECEIEGVNSILNDYDTNGISYLNLMFDMKKLPGDLYPYMSILSKILGQVDTDKHSYGDLNNEINLVAGGYNVTRDMYSMDENPNEYKYYLTFKMKYLSQNVSAALDLLEEIMFESHLDDSVRLLEILSEMRSQMQASMTSAGHTVAVGRAAAAFRASEMINEITSGVEFYHFLADLLDHYDERKDELSEKLAEASRCILRPENFMINLISTNNSGADGLGESIKAIKSRLYTSQVRAEEFVPELLSENEALMTAGQVLYVCRAGNFFNKGISYNGHLPVLGTIMGYQYLWVNVRVKGGAYGCMSGFEKSGLCYFVSYRDPNLSKTIEVYENAPNEIENFEADERTMTQFIIGTISTVDHPLTPSGKGARSLRAYLTGLKYETAQKRRDELLNTQPEDIRELAKHLKAFLSDNRLVVVGNAAKIKEEKELFTKVSNLF